MAMHTKAGEPCTCVLGRGVCDRACVQGMLDTTFYVACLNLSGRRCVVVGGGRVATEKVEGLLACAADVTVIAPTAEDALRQYAAERTIRLHERPYAGPADLQGAFLVVAATAENEVNTRVFDDAERRQMLVNVVDVPRLCNFILPALVRIGPLAIAISTAGASPALAKRMRSEVAELFGEEHAQLAVLLNDLRGWAKETLGSYGERKRFFESIVNGDPDPLQLLRSGQQQAVRQLIADRQKALVGEPAGA